MSCTRRSRSSISRSSGRQASTSSCTFSLPTSARRSRVRTDLTIAIFDAFAEAGIEIPFTQTDVNIRNIDRLHELVADYAAKQEEQSLETGRRQFTKVPAVAD